MARRRTVDDWRRAVYRSHAIGDPVRVLLLFLAEHMKSDRTLSVKRDVIATALGKSERRVSERVSAAHEAGFLSTISPGYRGHVPVYQGLFPDEERVTPTSTLSSAETRTLSMRKRVTPGGPTITTADLSASTPGRDVGSNDGHAPTADASRVTVCTWHEHTPCPDDCANHPANREAS